MTNVLNYMNIKRIFTICVSILLILALFSFPGEQRIVKAQSAYPFISNPGKVPLLSEFETPVMRPGNSGTLRFNLTNRYSEFDYPSSNMTDVELTLGIYRYVTLEKSKLVDSNFRYSPKLEKDLSVVSSREPIPEESRGIVTVEPETGIKLFRFYWPVLPSRTTYTIELLITSESNTPEGIYSIKTEINFNFVGIENRTFTMRSLGYYTDEEWDYAEETAPENFAPGINLTALGIDGIIPETTFSVTTPMPFWPFYLLGGLTLFFGVLAVMFYYMEEHNKFPKLKAKLDELFGRFKRK